MAENVGLRLCGEYHNHGNTEVGHEVEGVEVCQPLEKLEYFEPHDDTSVELFQERHNMSLGVLTAQEQQQKY